MTMTKDVRQEFIEYCKSRLKHHSKLLEFARKHSDVLVCEASIAPLQYKMNAYYDVIDDIEYDMSCDTRQCCGEQNDCCTKS